MYKIMAKISNIDVAAKCACGNVGWFWRELIFMLCVGTSVGVHIDVGVLNYYKYGSAYIDS